MTVKKQAGIMTVCLLFLFIIYIIVSSLTSSLEIPSTKVHNFTRILAMTTPQIGESNKAAEYLPPLSQEKAGGLSRSAEGWNLGSWSNFRLSASYKLSSRGFFTLRLRDSATILIGDPEQGPLMEYTKGRGGILVSSNHQARRLPDRFPQAPAEVWNRLEFELVGENLTLSINGLELFKRLPLDSSNTQTATIAATGISMMIADNTSVQITNLQVQPIGYDETISILQSNRGFVVQSLFDGKSLAGWQGDIDRFAVVDGEIRSKTHPSGFIFFDQVLTNYHLQFEFKLPPGGNSGVALRYPGVGQPHLSGLELQILDSGHSKYADLDPRQYHGSVYGIAAAHQGYLHPPGHWNYQEIDYVGTHIRVRLNGYTILQTDLSAVTESLIETLPTGITQVEGQFGILSHNDPVAFRNIAYSPLPAKKTTPYTHETSSSPTVPIDLLEGENFSKFYSFTWKSGYADPTSLYRFHDGLLHVRGDDYGGLMSLASYHDYHMILEFKWGESTWGARAQSARDTGFLLHGYGPDGAIGPWTASLEVQIIEGGTGDILALPGLNRWSGEILPASFKGRHTGNYFDPDGALKEWTSGRLNWWGRSPNWKDEKGFRGIKDIENLIGEWNRLEVIAKGDSIEVFLNDQRVNVAEQVYPQAGRIGIQSELAEFWIKSWKLYPLE